MSFPVLVARRPVARHSRRSKSLTEYHNHSSVGGVDLLVWFQVSNIWYALATLA